jgi:hypothetical protein
MCRAAENHSRNPSWPATLPWWSAPETRPRRPRNVLEGLVEIAVQQSETETLRSGLFNRRLPSARDFSISGQ